MGNHSDKETLENIEGAIKKGQSRETGNNGNTRPRKAMQKKKNKTKRKHNMLILIVSLYVR
jgi:hypothetical protein